MFYQHTKWVIRYIWCGSQPTFILANRGFRSPCPSTYYFLGCNIFLLGSVLLVVHNPQTIPTNGKNFLEYVHEFIRDISKTKIGEEYGQWVSFIGTMFLFIFVSKCSEALLPLKIIQLSHGELATPTNDINAFVALALLTSLAYFYAYLPINT